MQGRYAERHPDWTVIEAHAPDGPWVKASAVASAVRATNADVLVIADADVWADGITDAVGLVTARIVDWAVPHFYVHRLTQDATTSLLAGTPTTGPLDEEPYRGVDGGGIVVLTRELLARAPLDPRFTGWGQEDEAWGYALTCLAGPSRRLTAPLTHLWHPPAPRRDRAVGSHANELLLRDYQIASPSRYSMNAILEEARRHEPESAFGPGVHDHPSGAR